LQSQEPRLSPSLEELKKKDVSLLPILTVLFLISYALLVVLVVEQGNTITSQRWLIKQLFVDSAELTALKGKALQDRKAEAQPRPEVRPKSHSQDPSPRVPADRAKESPADRTENQADSKPRKSLRHHPPKPAEDLQDVRRNVVSI
jgi:hypothetical protein